MNPHPRMPRTPGRARGSGRARAALFLPAVLVVVGLASCAGSDEGDRPPESAPLTAEATPTSAPAPEPEPSAVVEPTATPTAQESASAGSAGSSEPITVPGTVSARRGDCLYFTAGDMAESWVLVGRTSGLRPGDQVEVDGSLSGTPDPACEGALPFEVTTFRRL